MLRILGKTITGLFLGTLAISAGAYVYGLWEKGKISFSFSQSRQLAANQLLRKEAVFTLHSEKYIDFPLSGASKTLRIRCHGDVDPKDIKDLGGNSFTVLIEALDGYGNIIKKYLDTFKVKFSEEQANGQRNLVFYEDSSDVPTLRHSIEINLNKINPDRIRLKLIEKDPILKNVWASVLEVNNEAGRTLLAKWYHLPEAHQHTIANGSVYPPSLLSNNEKKNLIHNLYRPIGPAGIEGKDYTQRVLSTIESKNDEVFPLYPYQAIYSDKNHEVVLPLSQDNNHIKVDVFPVSSSGEIPSTLHVTWYGQGPRTQDEFDVSLTKDNSSFEKDFQRGYVYVKSMQPSWIVSSINGSEKEIRKPKEVMYYQLSNKAISFDVTSSGSADNILRIASRCVINLTDKKNEEKNKTIRYTVLDHQGGVLHSGEIKVPLEISTADGLVQNKSVVVSQGLDQFISLPPAAETLVLQGDNSVFVAVYNTLPNSPRLLKIPEDIYSFGGLDEARRSNWFSLQPKDSEKILQEKRNSLFAFQPQPHSDDPYVNQGVHQFDEFMPQEKGVFRHILIPNEDLPIRLRGLAVVFTRLSPRTPSAVTFEAQAGAEVIQPRLIFVKDREDAAPFALKINNQVIFEESLRGRSGELSLPPIKAGEHQVEVVSDYPVFINYIKPGHESYLQKNALHWKGEEIVIPVSKQLSEEVLSLQLFSPQLDLERVKVDVKIQGPYMEKYKNSDGYTIRNRQYDVAFQPIGEGDFIIDAESQKIRASWPIFIKVAEDLSGTNYKIVIKPEGKGDLYLSLSRIIPGWNNERKSTIQGTMDVVE